MILAQPLECGVLVLMVEFLVETGKLEASRLFCLGSGVYAFYAILGQGSANGNLLCKATGAVGFWLETDMEVGCPFNF